MGNLVTPLRVFLVNARRTLELGRELSSGGEGSVYVDPEDRNSVVKVYHQEISDERRRKLEAMVRVRPRLPLPTTRFAWPTDMLTASDNAGKVIGFKMPRIPGQPVQDIFNIARSSLTLDASLVARVALSAAEAVQQIHAINPRTVLSDINSNNFLVDAQQQVGVIDIDSAQLDLEGVVYKASAVGINEYASPEIIRSPDSFPLEQHQDDFSLGIVIWRLLFDSVFPFNGVFTDGPRPPCKERVVQGLWPYRQGGIAGCKPLPDAPSFDELPESLKLLFDATFSIGVANPAVRPTAKEWQQALEAVLANGEWLKAVKQRLLPQGTPLPRHVLHQAARIVPTIPRRTAAAAVAASLLIVGVYGVTQWSVAPASTAAPAVRTETSAKATPLYWRQLTSRSH